MINKYFSFNHTLYQHFQINITEEEHRFARIFESIYFSWFMMDGS